MKIYELCFDNDKEILQCMKEIILDRHPIVEDRMDVLFPSVHGPRKPEMGIHFIFNRYNDSDITQILFLDGTEDFKTTIPDRIQIDGLISKKLVCDFVSYLLTDHDCFRNIYKKATSIELPMVVDARDDNMHGISCGEINLCFDFTHHPDYKSLLNDYLKIITTTFYEELKKTSSFEKEFSDYCNSIKHEFINSLTIDDTTE